MDEYKDFLKVITFITVFVMIGLIVGCSSEPQRPCMAWKERWVPKVENFRGAGTYTIMEKELVCIKYSTLPPIEGIDYNKD